MTKTRDFAEVIRRKLADDPDLAAAVERESFNADVAAQIYQSRRDAGLTQAQLAERARTHQSVIARLEAADYDGHSLSMLWRIADALGKQLRIEFYSRFESADVTSTTYPDIKPVWAEQRRWEPSFHTETHVRAS